MGRRCVVPCTRRPATPVAQDAACWRISSKVRNRSPAKQLPHAQQMVRSTRGLSCGRRTRARSTRRPRACEYSRKVSFSVGRTGSGLVTMAFWLSASTIGKTPPKKAHAA
jgi:hypothetical protein